MVKVKICGITNLEDGRAAIAAGADMLGFNFYPPSPRFIEPAQAREIITRLKAESADLQVTMVGIFVNEPSESVLQIVEETGIDAVQLHGDESPEFCAELRRILNGQRVIKALRVKQDFQVSDVNRYEVDAIMLDAFHEELRGGTGRTFDWELARTTRELAPRLFLSGGLTPENVAGATVRVRPYAVDACSSLESRPGHKDALRMKEFVQAARRS